MEVLIDITLLTVSAVTAYSLVCLAWKAFDKGFLSPWTDRYRESIPSVPEKIKFFGGPLNAKVALEKEPNSFYIVPFMPDDPEERGEPIMQLGDKVMFQPHFAYYTQADDNQYIYVREVSMEEMELINQTGIPPVARIDDKASE